MSIVGVRSADDFFFFLCFFLFLVFFGDGYVLLQGDLVLELAVFKDGLKVFSHLVLRMLAFKDNL